jgi:hypothetical protein
MACAVADRTDSALAPVSARIWLEVMRHDHLAPEPTTAPRSQFVSR